ncbi:MAG: DUF1553 domain-containing protein, partial [Leptospiraceae bacterium]|nr:DUF1553 domain-containing protein [Leptospiraceae bacterium]
IRGVLPTVSEIQEFEKSPPENRVAAFAVRFLRDPDAAHYWALQYGSALRSREDQRGTEYGSYFEYLARSFHENKPYNKMVAEMILATGDTAENPAANFYLRDDADPLQVAEYVGRVFYGERLACARCHDHPFNSEFSRRDYYGFAAFFSQVYVKKRYEIEWLGRERLEHFPADYRKEYEEKRNDWNRNVWNKMNQQQKQAWQRENKLEYYKVAYEPMLALRFPHTDDQPGGDLVEPQFPDGTRALVDEGEDRRRVFVRWLTSQRNDRFRKVMINRVWTELMGWSFFTPLDDWNPNTRLRHPEILEHLDQVFLEREYRIKDLIFYIVTSDAYARRAPRPGDADAGSDVAYFRPQRINADQLLNSMLRGTQTQQIAHVYERAAQVDTESGDDIRRRINLEGMGELKSPQKNVRDLTNACEVPRPAHERTLLAMFGAGPRLDVDDDSHEPTIDQVLALLNGNTTYQLVSNYGGDDSWIRRDFNQHKDMLVTLDNIYLALLGRHLSSEEKEQFTGMISSRYQRQEDDFNRELTQDIVWSILNSQEFIHLY